MPDFICIGGQRTGTTWLHHVLSCNDAIWMPPCKELHHFDALCPEIETYSYRYGEHLRSRLRHYGLAAARKITRQRVRPDVHLRLDWDWDLRYFGHPGRSTRWYESLFETREARNRITGEITPAYSLLPADHVRGIIRALPQVKVIVILRDPVARAWSQALKDLPTKAAQDDDRMIRFLRANQCVERSNWPAILQRWEAVLPPKQLLVLDFQEIRAAPERFLSRISDFLGVALALPEDMTGASQRERGASSHRSGAISVPVVEGIADLYAPILAETARRYPEIAGPWLKTAHPALLVA